MIWKIESENHKADIFTKGVQGQVFVRISKLLCVGKPSDERECSEKLHLQSYLEILWSETGYFGLLGIILYCLLSYYILSKDKGL